MNSTLINNIQNFSHASIEDNEFFLHFSNENGKISSFNKNKIISHKVARKSQNSLWFFEQKSIYKELFSKYEQKAISQDQLIEITNNLIFKFKEQLLSAKLSGYDEKLKIYNNIFSKFKTRKISALTQDSTFNGESWSRKVMNPLFEVEKDYILRMDSERFMTFLIIKEGLIKVQDGYDAYGNFCKIKDALIKKSTKILSYSKHKNLKKNLEAMDEKIKNFTAHQLADMSSNINTKFILNTVASDENLNNFILNH